MISIVLVSATLLSQCLYTAASPLQTEEKEHRADAGNSLESLVEEFRDSTVYPILLNPFAVNKLHCGSVITFYDNTSADSTDATVAVDICLTAFIIAKALVLFTLLTEGVDLERLGDGGVFSILDTVSEALTRLDLAGSGPEGEPFEGLAAAKNDEDDDVEDEIETGVVQKQQTYAYVPSLAAAPEENYVGFGFNSWKSGPQSFPDLSEFYDSNLARSFGDNGKFGQLLKATLHQLDNAVSVNSK